MYPCTLIPISPSMENLAPFALANHLSAMAEAAMAKKRPERPKRSTRPPATEVYEHTDATVALRPDVGTQAQFKKQKPAQRYCYDSSLAPALDWDGQNAARELGDQQL